MDLSALLPTLLNTPALWAIVTVFLLLCLLSRGRKPRRAPSHRSLLRTIRRTPITPRAVLNQSERRLHRDLAQIVARSGAHVLLAQVSMGEFLKAGGRGVARAQWQTVFNTFNAKRVDFLIVDADWLPCAVVEYQGKGHYQGNARARDAVKKAVCAQADIPFIEVASAGLTTRQARDLSALLDVNRVIAAQ